jgi:hypothetical protein
MSTVGQLILINVGTALAVAFFVANIRGRMAEATYEARMASFARLFLMPGRLANREVWVRQQKVLSWFGLILAGIVYVSAMIKILS